MDAINRVMTVMFDWLLAPLAAWPAVALIVVSVICGAGMLLAFRYASNQAALERAAAKSKASVMALRLFRDDLGVALRGQIEMFGAVGRRLWHSIPPMLVLVIPFVVIISQLALRYEHRPLKPGETTVLEVSVTEDAWPAWREATLEIDGDAMAVETPAFRDDDARRLTWRLRANQAGAATLIARAADQSAGKQAVVDERGRRLRAVSLVRSEGGLTDRTLHPGESALPAETGVVRMTLAYPDRTTRLLGFDVPWWLTFLIVSMVAAFALKGVAGVSF